MTKRWSSLSLHMRVFASGCSELRGLPFKRNECVRLLQGAGTRGPKSVGTENFQPGALSERMALRC